MKIITTIRELQKELDIEKRANKKIGFVPTMGALHKGHISLVDRSVKENEVTVVSIFVNPTQFNDLDDLAKYPKTPEDDFRLLDMAHTSIVFVPEILEMYPVPDDRTFNFYPLDEVMEGKFRKGHFNGVAQIVSKLFEAVKPDKAYFGEKDFQQLAIIREMVKQYQFPIEIVGCPIVREESGLALSSRNTRLSKEKQRIASNISKVLFLSIEFASSHTIEETRKFVIEKIESEKSFNLDYFEIVDIHTLQSLQEWPEDKECIGCIAVYCGEVRLIDNVKYRIN